MSNGNDGQKVMDAREEVREVMELISDMMELISDVVGLISDVIMERLDTSIKSWSEPVAASKLKVPQRIVAQEEMDALVKRLDDAIDQVKTLDNVAQDTITSLNLIKTILPALLVI